MLNTSYRVGRCRISNGDILICLELWPLEYVDSNNCIVIWVNSASRICRIDQLIEKTHLLLIHFFSQLMFWYLQKNLRQSTNCSFRTFTMLIVMVNNKDLLYRVALHVNQHSPSPIDLSQSTTLGIITAEMTRNSSPEILF